MSAAQRIVLIFALCFAVCGVAQAQDTLLPNPSTATGENNPSLQAARKLLEATHANANFTQVFEIIIKQLMPIMSKANPDKQSLVQSMFDKYFTPIVKKHAGEFIEQAAGVYAQNFTAEEMQQITAFYLSPAGQKFIQKSPVMMQQMLQSTQELRQQVIKEALQNLVGQMRQNNMQVPKEIGL